MNEKAIQDIVAGVLKNVMENMRTPLPDTAACPEGGSPIPVELSARHVHLSEADALALFGAPLTPARELSQPGQFLCNERVRLIGPKGVMDNVAILGPARSFSQVEISKTDARALGVDVPVRQSGDIAGSPGIILASRTGFAALAEGLIVAARHIHMNPEDADKFCVKDNDLVSVRLSTEDRPVILEDVLVRVNAGFRLAMHIDSDEGNSAGWKNGISGQIVNRRTIN